jgi:exoribonuclease R
MQDGVGKDFKGVVSGVTEWGLYIEIIENKCEGMIKLKEIRNDYYYFDEANFRVIGQNSGKIINLGDELTIKVVRADLMRKQLDFILVDDQFSD